MLTPVALSWVRKHACTAGLPRCSCRIFEWWLLGLEWLASPDVDPPVLSSKKSTSHGPKVAPKATTASIVDAKDAGVGTKSDNATAGPPGHPGHDLADIADATGGISKVHKTDGAPAGGCMPIGLTANGQMVFPLQCRELIERQHGPAPSPASVVAAASVPALQDTGARKTDTSDNIVAGAPMQAETPVAHRLQEYDTTKRPPSSNGRRVAATTTNEFVSWYQSLRSRTLKGRWSASREGLKR